MKRTCLISAFFIALLCGVFVGFGQAPCDNSCPNYVEVRAVAEKRIQPDIAYLKLSIREADEKRNPINMAETERKLLELLDKLAIDRGLLKVEGLSGIQQKINRRRIGHIQSKRYTLKLTDFAVVDDLLDELDKLKVIDIYLNKLDNSKIDEHKLALYAAAMTMAKKKAEAMLNAVGQTTGPVLYAVDNSDSYYPVYQRNLANVYLQDAMPGAEPMIDNDVSLDDIVVRQQLTVRFEIAR